METKYPKEILEAIQRVMAAVPYIQKSGRNTFNNYNYASEADVLRALRPAMLAAGLVFIPSIPEEPRLREMQTQKGGTNILAYVTVEYTLAHGPSGQIWPEKLRAEGCGMDTQDKAVAKAITSATKYFLLKFFQIETGDDPDKDVAHDSGPGDSAAGKESSPAPSGNPGASPKESIVDFSRRNLENAAALGIFGEWWEKHKDGIQERCKGKQWEAICKIHGAIANKIMSEPDPLDQLKITAKEYVENGGTIQAFYEDHLEQIEQLSQEHEANLEAYTKELEGVAA